VLQTAAFRAAPVAHLSSIGDIASCYVRLLIEYAR
jgi:hypothetical protein